MDRVSFSYRLMAAAQTREAAKLDKAGLGTNLAQASHLPLRARRGGQTECVEHSPTHYINRHIYIGFPALRRRSELCSTPSSFAKVGLGRPPDA